MDKDFRRFQEIVEEPGVLQFKGTQSQTWLSNNKKNNLQGPTVCHRELCSILCNWSGKEIWRKSSVQFSRSVVSDSLQPHESQHARPPCPSPTPRVYPDSCPSGWWCHPAISSSVIPLHVYVSPSHFAVCLKLTQYCKATILQYEIKKFLKRPHRWLALPLRNQGGYSGDGNVPASLGSFRRGRVKDVSEEQTEMIGVRIHPGRQSTPCKHISSQTSWRNAYTALEPMAKSSRGCLALKTRLSQKCFCLQIQPQHFLLGDRSWSPLGNLCLFSLCNIRLEIIKGLGWMWENPLA